MEKVYVVFGGVGSIGSQIALQLVANGHVAIAPTRRFNYEMDESGVIVHYISDVGDYSAIDRYAGFIVENYRIAGVIYAVGHCPPKGFLEAIKYPLSQLPLEKYEQEINMHQRGALNVYKAFGNRILEGSCFLFMSSAITRLRGKFPPFLQAHYHASVIDAQDWLIEGMRHDPIVVERKIKIHRLAPSAVDTSFHQGDGPKPPAMISVDSVVDEVMQALKSDTHVDKQLLPA